MTLPQFFRTRTGGWVAALGFVVLWYALLQGVALWIFHVSPRGDAVPRDLAAHLLLGAALYALSRNLRWFLALAAVLLAALHLSNAGKIVVLGGPIMPDDFLAARNLFLLLHGWRLAGAVLIVAVPLILLALATSWRSRRAWVVLSGAALAVTAFLVAPGTLVRAMDAQLGNIVWNQRGNYEGRGLLLHLVQESARYLSRADSPPSRPDVTEALARLGNNNALLPAALRIQAEVGARRNVHVILLESFWDPMPLKAAGISADPVDPRFRALWKAAGHSQAMSPVFGGYTANAEFEVLCGFPVTEDAVFFEGWLRRDVPCLPRHLGAVGYHSVASHPNIAAFWNRVNAYHRIGFDTYWSDKDFVLDDMNRSFLSDASLYRQVLEKLRPSLDAGIPLFDYIVTFFGHLHYPLNEQRPHRIDVSQNDGLIEPYVNTIYYKSRELMDFLERLSELDPDALIVLFGDHLPFLGPNFAGFTDSGLLADNRSKFDAAMVRRLVSTPLVVIDGRRGPVPVGDVAMYQLPALILKLLGDDRPSVLRLLASPPHPVVRPLPGMHFAAQDEWQALCRQNQEAAGAECALSEAWLDAAITLTRDLFGGDQYTLQDSSPGGVSDRAALVDAGGLPPSTN